VRFGTPGSLWEAKTVVREHRRRHGPAAVGSGEPPRSRSKNDLLLFAAIGAVCTWGRDLIPVVTPPVLRRLRTVKILSRSIIPVNPIEPPHQRFRPTGPAPSSPPPPALCTPPGASEQGREVRARRLACGRARQLLHVKHTAPPGLVAAASRAWRAARPARACHATGAAGAELEVACTEMHRHFNC